MSKLTSLFGQYIINIYIVSTLYDIICSVCSVQKVLVINANGHQLIIPGRTRYVNEQYLLLYNSDSLVMTLATLTWRLPCQRGR